VRFEGGAPEPYFIPHLLQQLGIETQEAPVEGS
jgi:hypothetical protein